VHASRPMSGVRRALKVPEERRPSPCLARAGVRGRTFSPLPTPLCTLGLLLRAGDFQLWDWND
jgi:hypothetical protein